jgi:hypothetical protein
MCVCALHGSVFNVFSASVRAIHIAHEMTVR